MASQATSDSTSLEAPKVSRLIPKYIRKLAAKWKNITGHPVSADCEPTAEQEARTGWDSHADSEGGPSIEQETTPGWDSHAVPLFEEPEDRSIDERDSGYVSLGDTPSKSSKKDPSLSESTDAIKYSQLPFRTKHYLLTYTQQILESTCLRYARKNLRRYLEDPDWKKINLQFPSKEYLSDRLVDRDWLVEDEIELESWMQMFADRVSMPRSKRIFESVIDLRNAAVHRGDREELGFKEFSYAMKLPELLGDSKGESEITNTFRYVLEDRTLDEDTKASVEKAMYTTRTCTTHYQVLNRIQTLLEETCFNNAARKIPEVLSRNGWHTPEQIELQNWQNIFQNAGIIHDDSANDILPDVYPGQLSDLLWGARLNIRNILAHRLPISDEKLITQVQRAINLCILQSDWIQAVEIEFLAEGYFTKTSRQHVLNRLEHAHKNGSADTPYERQRRVAIAEVIARTEEMEVCEGDDAPVPADECDVGVSVQEVWWANRTFSPSMHETLKRVEVL